MVAWARYGTSYWVLNTFTAVLESLLGIALLPPDRPWCFAQVRILFPHALCGKRRVGAVIPDDFECVTSNFGRPKSSRNNRNPGRHLYHVFDSGNGFGLVGFEAHDFSAEHGGPLDDSDKHTGDA